MTKIDAVNIFLLLAAIFLGVNLVILKPPTQSEGEFIAPITENVLSSEWGRNRNFPTDFTEEERIILTEQHHDYERTTDEMDRAYQKFLDLMQTYRSRTPILTVYVNQDDCFVRPVILSIRSGAEVTINNPSSRNVSLGMGDQGWDIGAGKTTVVYPKLDKSVSDQIYWGYACSDKGLAGYLVREN